MQHERNVLHVPFGDSMTKLTSKEIVDLSREYTFFSWSVQGQANPIQLKGRRGSISGMPMENGTLIFRLS
jgi:hypothetical protein